MQWFSYIPNAITVARILSMIPLVWFMLQNNYEIAFYIALAAGFSDALDGYLAKKYGWEGWLGGVLDPLADKFMMLCCYLVFAIQGIVSTWFFLLIVIRDIIIISGSSYYHFRVSKVKKAKPNALSKLNTAFQILLILVLLLHYSLYQFNPKIIEYLTYTVIFLTISSCMHYIIFWGRKALQIKSKE